MNSTTMDTSIYTGQQANLYNAVAMAIFGCFAFLFAAIPATTFWKNNNVAAVSLVVITAITNFITVINAIIWHSDDQSTWFSGIGLCDVEVYLRFPITIALACSLCTLTRRLSISLAMRRVMGPTAAEKRRIFFTDLALCWALPVIQVALHYVVQAGRYQIWPVFGCSDNLDASWPLVVIILMWCPLIAIANVFFVGLLLYRLYQVRDSIQLAMQGSGNNLRGYIRLVLITLVLVCLYLPTQILFIVQSFPRPQEFLPYDWHRVHSNPWAVHYFHTVTAPTLQYRGWANIATGLLIWVIFGFDDRCSNWYRSILVTLGFARFFPTLKLTRRERLIMARQAGKPRGRPRSMFARLNPVNAAVKFFGGDAAESTSSDGLPLHKRRSTSLNHIFGFNKRGSTEQSPATTTVTATTTEPVITPPPTAHTRGRLRALFKRQPRPELSDEEKEAKLQESFEANRALMNQMIMIGWAEGEPIPAPEDKIVVTKTFGTGEEEV